MFKKFMPAAGAISLLAAAMVSPVYSKVIPKAAAKSGLTALAVTDIKVEKTGSAEQEAEITLNDAVVIKEIKVTRENGETNLNFPTYVSRAGKPYSQVTVLSKNVRETILRAIETGKPTDSADKQYTLSYKITKFSPYTRPSALKVFCAVAINGALEIECKVMEGDRGPWIAWPSRKPQDSGTWVKQVIITNKALRDAIEKTLLKKYQDIRKESGSSSGGEPEY